MLERELRELRVAWPETPDLAGAVEQRLPAAPPPRRRFEWPAWQIAVAAAAVLIAVVMAVPPARSAVLEWLGLASVRIERGEPRFGADLRLGEPVTLAEARRRAGFPLVVPSALGEPDAVYLSPDPVTGTRVEFVYRPRDGLPRSPTTGVGLLMTQFPAPTKVVVEKTVGANTRVERLEVAGDPAYFISGAPHGFAYESRGRAAFEEQRMAGNTLLVERSDGLLLRLEGSVARDEAARIAASAR
jgi:hypothetical protein